jgi:excisionase family DNA binding protein
MSRNEKVQSEPLLTRAEVAAMFGVDAQTVTRWARKGRLTAVRTPGGHRRFSEREVRQLLEGVPRQETDEPSSRQSRGVCLVCGQSELLDLDGEDASAQMAAFAERHSRHERFHIDVGVHSSPSP